MKLMGIDYGTKRVGVALSDDKAMMAFPHTVLPNDDALLKALDAIIEQENVDEIIIGHSLDRKGGTNAIHEKVEEFIQDCTLHFGLPVKLEPEQYTTQEAVRFQGRTALTDASAASIILNSFITRDKK